MVFSVLHVFPKLQPKTMNFKNQLSARATLKISSGCDSDTQLDPHAAVRHKCTFQYNRFKNAPELYKISLCYTNNISHIKSNFHLEF